MSEQAPNSPTDVHSVAEQAIESMFLRREGVPQEPQSQKPRNPDGTFAAKKEDPAGAEPAATEPQGDPAGQEPPQEAAPQSEEVEVDFDIGGEKKIYRIPKEISDRFIQHADYTRKTQDLAELRRVATAEREALGLQKAFETETVSERQQLTLLDAQIEAYKNVNWGAIEDTRQLIQLREQLNQLKEQRATVDQAIQAKRGKFDEQIKAKVTEAVQSGVKYLQQHIKGFDQKTVQALHEYGQREGYTQQELGGIIDPRLMLTLWKASKWDELQSSQPGITKRAATAAPVVRPGATQKTVTRVQAAAAAINKATTQKGKQQATEDYFAARFGER